MHCKSRFYLLLFSHSIAGSSKVRNLHKSNDNPFFIPIRDDGVHKSNSLYFRCLTVAKKDGSMEVWERETFKHDDGLCHC